MFYSASTNGFYSSDIHTTMPEDVIEITDQQHQDLLAQNAAGQIIDSDVNGHPIAVNAPEMTADQNKAFILGKIKALETEKQPRALRDALLNNDHSRLQAIEDEIAVLRSQMQ